MYRTPASAAGTSARDRSRDQHLLGPGHELRELGPALGVELGEDVVEDQDRVVAIGPEQVVRREPQGQREGPRLPVRGVPLDRQPVLVRTVPQAQQALVAVRADQGDAAVELVVAPSLDLAEQRLGEILAVVRPPRSNDDR